MKPKYILYLSMIFLFIGITQVATAQQGQGGSTQINLNQNQGLQIFYPDFSAVKKDSSFELHIHATNLSTGLYVNTTQVSCGIELFNITGGNILDTQLTPTNDDGEFFLFINGANFSELGFMAWKLYCEEAGIVGGTASGRLQVTATGETLNGSITSLNIFFILLFLLLIPLQLYGTKQLPKQNNRDEEGRIISINHLKYLRILIYGSLYFTIYGFLFYSGSVMEAYLINGGFGSLLIGLSSIMGYMSIPLIIITMFRLIENIVHDREIKRLLQRGIEFGEDGEKLL